MMYVIKVDLLKLNRSHKPLRPVGMVLHSTATDGATDEAEIKYFNGGDRQASAHGFIDWDSITQCIPYNERGWHAGATANSKFIGIELCEPKGKDIVKFNEVYKRAVWYFAYIFVNVLRIKTVTKSNLMSHDEVSDKWKETTHTDPVAYFREYGKTVDGFRKDVQAMIKKGVK